MVDPNEPWIDYLANVFFAHKKAILWCMFHWSQSHCWYEGAQGRITFIGTCTGSFKAGNLEIVKTFYGEYDGQI